MPFKKGNKDGHGRPKGAQNKEKKALRELLTTFLEENYDKFLTELFKLEGKEFSDRFIQLLEYATPKLNRTDLTNDGEKFDFNTNGHTAINKLNQILTSYYGRDTKQPAPTTAN